MKRALTAVCLLSLCATGCAPMMMHGMMAAESAQKVEWERQNFEREKAGMPLLTFKDWQGRQRDAGKTPEDAQRDRRAPPNDM